MSGYWAVYGGDYGNSDGWQSGSPTGHANFPEAGVNILGQISIHGIGDATDPMSAEVRFTEATYLDDNNQPQAHTINGPVFQLNRVTRVDWEARVNNGGVYWSVLFLEADL